MILNSKTQYTDYIQPQDASAKESLMIIRFLDSTSNQMINAINPDLPYVDDNYVVNARYSSLVAWKWVSSNQHITEDGTRHSDVRTAKAWGSKSLFRYLNKPIVAAYRADSILQPYTVQGVLSALDN